MLSDRDRPLIYVSYSKEDAEWREYLLSFLTPAVGNEAEIWSDQSMELGAPWREETENKLRQCDIFVILLSPNSIASEFINNIELATTLKRRQDGEAVLVDPILVSAVSPIPLAIRDFMIRPSGLRPLDSFDLKERQEQMATIVEEIAGQAGKLREQMVGDAPSPPSSVVPPPDPATPPGSHVTPNANLAPQKIDAYVPFRKDAPSETEDALDRGPLALFLGRRLHLIWCEMNGCAPRPKSQSPAPVQEITPEKDDGDTFIVHIDAPWGGGKTTFANFVARVLDPRRSRLGPNHFLRWIASPTATPADLAKIRLDTIFYADPDAPAEERERWPDQAQVPWIIARYNAWRDQYVYPPWWHIFQTIQKAILDDVAENPVSGHCRILKPGWWHEAIRRRQALLSIRFDKFFYQIWNEKIRAQLVLLAMMAALILVVWQTGLVSRIWSKSATPTKDTKDLIDLLVAILGFAGVSIATLFTVISQSLVPVLDFTAEHKQIGVPDPIGRFRRSFVRILRSARRPVLLIVDDIDRCEHKAVVEILRGFQTIVRSPRLFVIVLGDRAWIERAHEIYHKDFADIVVGTETKLGARFVEKMFQLSFTLPAMKPAVRDRFTKTVLGERPDGEASIESQALTDLDRRLKEAVAAPATVAQREQSIEQAKQRAVNSGAAKEQVDTLANQRLVAAAAADAGYKGEVFNILSQLADSLPNNPRQIKRIVNAFAIYETVGRLYFNYQLTVQGSENGELRARRWRQLALWVTLSTEWPDIWRAIARTPKLINVALAEPPAKGKLQQKLLAEQFDDAQRNLLKNVLHRLAHDYSLLRLLQVHPRPPIRQGQPEGQSVTGFPEVRLEPAAIYDFNRIMWEPNFPTQNPSGSSGPGPPAANNAQIKQGGAGVASTSQPPPAARAQQ
jgi:KAP family P-loop domain/TIR domain